MNPLNDNKGKHHHHHQQQRQDSAFTFNYLYTCDIEDVLFRVKIVNLDGILPPHSKNSSQHTTHGADSSKSSSSSPSSSFNFTSVHNHYEYNIVEDENNFTFIDDIISSDDDDDDDKDDENKNGGHDQSGDKLDDNEATTSGIESDEYRAHHHHPQQQQSSSSFLHPISAHDNSLDYNKELKKKQKKKKKLNEIIFGNLNQPFRALSNHPYLTCDLISNGRRLCPPQQTQYRQMINRYEWNEWLSFSLTLDTLPRDTIICFTIWDTICPGKSAAVARTSMTLFSKRGCMRKGLYDLRLFFNEDCKEYYNYYNGQTKMTNPTMVVEQQPPPISTISNDIITTDIVLTDINLTSRKHRKNELVINENDLIPKLRKHLNLGHSKDSQLFHFNNQQNRKLQQQQMKNFQPESLEFTSTQQYFEQDLSMYPIGTGDKSKKIQRFNKLKKRYYNNQLPKRESQDRRAFAEIEKQTVMEKSLSTFVFLTVEFPIIIMDGIEHTAVYFEDKDDQCCQYDIIDKDIVTIQDPEMNLPNLVEIKHHALARSARSGISLRDLKPNATIRNQLNAIVNYPSTQQLTSEEQDLIWKFRFYLRNQKKALTKFLKTVNWQSISEAEQAIELMNEWSPMDVDDALELLSPYFTHPAVRKYAVGRLKESASDEDLLLYLLQLVQALKYENFQEIRQAHENELLEYQQQQQQQQQQHQLQQHAIHRERKSQSESISSTTDTLMPESMKIFASTPSSNTSTIVSTSTTVDTTTVDHPSSSSIIQQQGKSPTRDKQRRLQNDDNLATFLLNRSCQNDELANYFFWYLCVECEGAKSFRISVMSSVATNSYLVPPPPPSIIEWENEQHQQQQQQQQQQKQTKLPASSVNELSGSYSITNVIDMYIIMMRRFSTRLLCGTPEMVHRRHFLLRQQDFVVKLVEIMKEIARESGNRMKKIEKLQSILESPEPQFRFNFNKNDPLPLPLNPTIRIIGVASKEALLYKSATMPAKLGFRTTSGQIFWTIFKNGDDLRQDDLVLQMINLMDKLLRKENLDLKLTPYRVLACSSKHGFVQFIDSQSVAEVMSIEGSIQNYLRKISHFTNTTPTISSMNDDDFQQQQQQHSTTTTSGSSPSLSPSSGLNQMGISLEIMDAYIKSCAGYCVITYLLGVGDRHLDNLLMTKTGRLFHIDFGFILGRDPKLSKPPMKITREMVDAMGGMDSENFYKFCSFVRTAFLHLRRHANLILNLFSLMIDANVPDIALEPDKTVQKVQDKFKLELNDEQADHYITEQVEQSVRSIMPVVVDQLHKMAQYLRN
ncbi:Phosphatidylinositol 3-kinase catalytic subunit type 3 [Dermatophagoides farinae]|uniref:phosphatidylinositol 3-kinase n=1 Tax=Dermatophagoides farinae TaxID=6954 RepID=A0A922L1U4_DERFA|nr:Phosphatidylinositol 3-kinase catalytic subunit type 3 [Dermatophagoides farinae]